MTRRTFSLTLVGAASVLPYLAARGLGDLRKQTIGFEIAFLGACVLYLIAVALVLRSNPGEGAGSAGATAASRFGETRSLALIWAFAVLFRLSLLNTWPTLSDDMFRYVWDGRVQASGISPYRYPPGAPAVADLRRGDLTDIWRGINRKAYVTVYPPGAQLAFAGIWRVAGNSVTGFKAAFVLAELFGGWALLRLLKAVGQPPQRILIYLWSPLLIFEVAHAGHVDGLVLPLLVGAFLARLRDRPGRLGLALGAAASVKLFPALLLPALLPLPRPLGRKGLRPAAKTLIGFVGALIPGYAFYSLFGRANPIGFLPHYLNEHFNLGLAQFVFGLADRFGVGPAMLANVVTFGGMALMSLSFILRPATSGRAALIRCIWLIGWFTLTTQNLFPWYLLWLLPLIALFAEAGRLLGFRLTPITAWLVFSATIGFAYIFFVQWRVVPWAQVAEYGPLIALLLLSVVARVIPRLRVERTGSAGVEPLTT